MQTVHYCTTFGNEFLNKELNFTSAMNITYRLSCNNTYLSKWGGSKEYLSYHRRFQNNSNDFVFRSKKIKIKNKKDQNQKKTKLPSTETGWNS